MTTEQYEALLALILACTTMPKDGEDVQERYDAAEKRARAAFLGYTPGRE